MNAKIRMAMQLVHWGFVRRAEDHPLEVCFVVLVIGLGALYALAASDLVFGIACLVLLALFAWAMYVHGSNEGPPDDSFAG